MQVERSRQGEGTVEGAISRVQERAEQRVEMCSER